MFHPGRKSLRDMTVFARARQCTSWTVSNCSFMPAVGKTHIYATA